MPRYIDTRGHTKIAIGICARCSLKFPYDDLVPDPNFPGLYVCRDDIDQFDPYRLPARETEDITLDHARPDVPIDGLGPSPRLWADPILVEIPGGLVDDLETESGEVITTEDGDPLATEG
jgi:hypothetical protein